MKNIFVSSTFRDMHVERDILALKVIPELNEYARLFGESVRFVDLRWGVNTSKSLTDEASGKKVLNVCLDEIDKTRPYMIILVGERYGWVPDEKLMKTAVNRKKYLMDDYAKSVTALEIEYGALSEKGQLERCLFYFREPLCKSELPQNIQNEYIEQNGELEQKLATLKEKIRSSGARIGSYSCEYDTENACLSVPESFVEMICTDVKSLFDAEFEKLRNLSIYEREEITAKLFAEQKATQFAARNTLLNTYLSEITSPQTRVFLLRGEPGSGKSTIMSKLYEKLSAKNETLFFVCANSPNSQTAVDLLKQIIYKIETLLGITERFVTEREPDEQSSIDEQKNDITFDDYVDKFEELACIYDGAETTKPLILLVDALDQIEFDNEIKNFNWLPQNLPEKVTVVLSMLDSFELPSFIPMTDISKTVILKQLSKSEIPKVISGMLGANKKQLPPEIITPIAELKSAVNPLFLSLVIQRLTMFDKDDFVEINAKGGSQQSIDDYMLSVIKSLPDTAEEMACAILNEVGERINKRFCDKVIALLAVSRRGLRVSDLQTIFKANNEEFDNADFALLTKYLGNFFLERIDGRIDFTHRVIRFGLLKTLDFEKNNRLIFEHLRGLSYDNIFVIYELIHHAYKANDKLFLIHHLVSDIYPYHTDKIKKAKAEELRIIALSDTEFVRDLFVESIYFYLSELGELVFSFVKEVLIPSASEYFVGYFLFTELLEKMVEKYGENPHEDELLVFHKAHEETAHIAEVLGKPEEALKYYIDDIPILKKIIETKNVLFDQWDIGNLYSRIGGVYSELGEEEASLKYYNLSLQISEELVAKEKSSINLISLSRDYINLGTALGTQDTNNALKYFLEAVKIREQVCEKECFEGYSQSLADAYLYASGAYTALKDVDNSLVYALKGLEIYEQMATECKDVSFYDNLPEVYVSVGYSFIDVGKYDESLQYLTKAEDYALVLLEKLNTQRQYYALSCVYSAFCILYEKSNQPKLAKEYYKKLEQLEKEWE